MASKRLSMRKIQRVLRLFFEAGLSIRAIARSVQASPSTVGDYIRRANTAGPVVAAARGARRARARSAAIPRRAS